MWRRKSMMLAAVALAALLAGVIAYLIETDEEKIERVLDVTVRAALRGDVPEVQRYVEQDATGGGRLGEGLLAPKIGYWVREARQRVEDVSLDLAGLNVEGDVAEGTWNGVATLKRDPAFPYGRVPFVAEVKFHRGPDGWRISHVVLRRP